MKSESILDVYIWLLSNILFVKETDVAKFAMCTIEDPRTFKQDNVSETSRKCMLNE
jgi:hypothetical protein